MEKEQIKVIDGSDTKEKRREIHTAVRGERKKAVVMIDER